MNLIVNPAARQSFDFDAALSDAQVRFDRKANQLSAQDRIVEELVAKLAQAQAAQEELQREYEQAAKEEEDLMKYLGVRYNDSPYQP